MTQNPYPGEWRASHPPIACFQTQASKMDDEHSLKKEQYI